MARKESDVLVIRRRRVERWQNINAAARRLGVTDTQVRRHISGEEPSVRLARRMEQAGIVVER